MIRIGFKKQSPVLNYAQITSKSKKGCSDNWGPITLRVLLKDCATTILQKDEVAETHGFETNTRQLDEKKA